jgi:hypothetical protein
MVEIEKMICIDSSGDWGGHQRSESSLTGIGSRTHGAAAMSIFGRVRASCDMSRSRRIFKLPVLGEASSENVRHLAGNIPPRLTNDGTPDNVG